MTRIKFCGLSRPRDIEEANALAADYIGFIFAKKSRRYVPPEKAKELKKGLDPQIMAVGVFVNEEPEKIAGLIEAGVIDAVQLHGTEDADYIRRLRQYLPGGIPVIRAASADKLAAMVSDSTDAQNTGLTASEELSLADMLLIDSPGGGTGRSFDWAQLERYTAAEEGTGTLAGMPFFLAGGLDADNAGEAVRRLHPYALDVSSGIETNGLKDPEKMRKFAASARLADAERGSI